MSQKFSVEEVAEAVIATRKRLGVSQRELARRLGMAAPTLNKIERGGGNIEAKTLLRIADALGVEPAILFGRYSEEFLQTWEMFEALPGDRKQRVIDHLRDQIALSHLDD